MLTHLAHQALGRLSVLPLYGGGFWVAFTQLTVFYYTMGAVLHFVLPRIVPVKAIQAQPRKRGEVLRDAFYSLGPLAVKAGVWALVERLHARGWGFTYEGSLLQPGAGAGASGSSSRSGGMGAGAALSYCLLCVALLDYLHDTWFYWTHRLLHWGPLYRHVHYIHHKSKAPSAFTGYSFHLVEALIVFANEVLVCFMFPLHMGLHRLYHLYTTLIHEGGHVGYELAPFIPTLEGLVTLAARGVRPRGGASWWLNTVQHHDLHHRFPTRHFSLYFTHWDRLCGTLHPAYDKDLFSYFTAPGQPSKPSQEGEGAGQGQGVEVGADKKAD
ncbi:hypothetical protein PLESTB_001743700 [Pleodorina starrii]|uniref:Fatty acid hydroxylase domain-containing protein n=1 Tax=Pleodorina starrii TaxID=330485 RepID=A0A9W6C043_9CHLO|nr:hypothetical protein PLESTM_001675700 [Pleodorina starrii]GLC61324.1 hypothetical protein PLESTB_001743700 [Pleodorina starrii]GLC69365.1 hypothetical protein PLESTF_000821200 [Pleodorina starrii]